MLLLSRRSRSLHGTPPHLLSRRQRLGPLLSIRCRVKPTSCMRLSSLAVEQTAARVQRMGDREVGRPCALLVRHPSLHCPCWIRPVWLPTALPAVRAHAQGAIYPQLLHNVLLPSFGLWMLRRLRWHPCSITYPQGGAVVAVAVAVVALRTTRHCVRGHLRAALVTCTAHHPWLQRAVPRARPPRPQVRGLRLAAAPSLV